jgi:hypothetical protein
MSDFPFSSIRGRYLGRADIIQDIGSIPIPNKSVWFGIRMMLAYRGLLIFICGRINVSLAVALWASHKPIPVAVMALATRPAIARPATKSAINFTVAHAVWAWFSPIAFDFHTLAPLPYRSSS